MYETFDAKVKLLLVRKVDWNAGGRALWPRTDFYVRVHTDPPFDERVPDDMMWPTCLHFEFAEDDEGKHVAFRCGRNTAWIVLRLRGEDRRIRECEASVGTDDRPHFERLVPIRQIVDRLMNCDQVDHAYQGEQIARAVLEDEGPEAAAAVVFEFAKRRLEFDAFEPSLASLDPPSYARTMTMLCGALAANETVPRPLFVRAAERCPLDAAVDEAALSMFRAQLADDQADQRPYIFEPSDRQRALLWSAILASARRPKEAGAIACEAVPRSAAWMYGSLRRVVIGTVLGRTQTSCEAVDAWLVHPPCKSSLYCDGGVCSDDDLRQKTRIWTDLVEGPRGADAGRVEDLLPLDLAQSKLFAAHARGPLPRSLVVVNERLHYSYENVPTADCNDETVAKGAVCSCYWYALCDVDPTETYLRDRNCAIRVDDEHKLVDIRRVCEAEGARCSMELPCCPGLRCEEGVDVCKPRPIDAGAEKR